MKSIVFIAPPAAGKGTQSSLICGKYNIPHISTGDILRKRLLVNDEQGIYIKKQLEKGHLVSDELMIELIEERICEDDCNNGYVLDGFPRTVIQAREYEEMLNRLNKDLGLVLLLDVSEETAKKRILGRMSCPTCGRVYNSFVEEAKPKVENLCDKCNSILKKRDDDNYETLSNRYQTYFEKTKPLIEFYESRNALYHIDGNGSVENTFRQIEKTIENVNLNFDSHVKKKSFKLR